MALPEPSQGSHADRDDCQAGRPRLERGRACTEPGCGSHAAARGLCNRHYKRHSKAGTLPEGLSLADRLWGRVTRSEGCWEWTGSVNQARWGYISVDGEMRLAHRVAYELHVGPIPDGLVVRHLCGNSLCVRPDHLLPQPR